MFAYFMDAEVTVSAKLVQIMYILSGVFCIYCGIRAWMKKDNKYYLPTGLFWSLLGLGVPFVISLGGNPLYMVTLAMTCGYCGTLLTPMAANFNIVPGVYLEIKDKYGIIKMQVIPSLIMLTFQIIYMCIAAGFSF